jgi:hypothetical protein
MINRHLFSAMLLGAALIIGPLPALSPASAESAGLAAYIGEEPTLFDTADAGVQAFKDTMAKGDAAAVARLLGLDAGKLEGSEGITDKLQQIREATAERVEIEDQGEQQVLDLGSQLWPFPFPLVKGEDGKWAFDTIAGLEEILNRRIGENELQAIETAQLYVQAQREYAAEDRDGDGVLEFAQKLISSDGQTDGLFWPIEQGDGESPVGASIDLGALESARDGNGYFGYKFRILTSQGDNVAGGAYDYVTNANMIGGFALIAWPARYAETGVSTFVINNAGILYEADFGPETEKTVEGIKSFNPDDSWSLVED